MTLYSYAFVRKDLPNIVKAVQVGHACLKAGDRFQVDGDHTFLVVFGVRNEKELLSTKARLESKGIRCAEFYEPDFNYGYTAFCTEPVEEDKRDIFKKYKLLTIE